MRGDGGPAEPPGPNWRRVRMTESAPTLSMRGISKSFAGNRVLSEFDLDLFPGEVHGLVGQNGSGKSTLVKILSGYHSPDSGGRLFMRSEEVPLPLSPGVPRQHGISFVHQDLALIDDMSIADNLFVGNYPSARRWRIDRSRVDEEARAALESYGLHSDPKGLLREMTAGQRAVVAIIRAVIEAKAHADAVIVLDEPTARLDHDESRRLFDAVRAAAASGASILFISHRLDEVRSVTDRVTVLRGGRKVATLRTEECTEDELVWMIVGAKLTSLYPEVTRSAARPVLKVRGLTGPVVKSLSFEVHSGEIVGLTGLPGAGFDEVPYLLSGALSGGQGEIVLGSAALDVERASVHDRLANGLAFVPGDRAREGAAMTLNVGENVTLPRLTGFVRHALLDLRAEEADALQCLCDFDVRPPRPKARFGVLSGGNQQKAILAKWLRTDPSVLVMHEPTQGVDIGARKQIFEMIGALGVSGKGVILASVEYEDLAHLAHRVLVFRRGAISRELTGSDLVKERILEECYRS